MRTAILWGLLALICQQTLVQAHVLGRASSTSDLALLKSLLQRFEETLLTADQEESPETDYEQNQPDPGQSQASQGWNQNQENQGVPLSEEQEPAEASLGRTQSQRTRLQNLLLATRSKMSGCFGARMDRIGNSSGLGCNSRKG
ncbi:natriuretic peptides A-like [Aplochiton taeniatus]